MHCCHFVFNDILKICYAIVLLIPLTISEDWQSAMPSNCNCERKFRPVCASDGHTYNNLCQLICQQQVDPGLHLLYEGTCCPLPSCPSHFDPVCDDQGRTHVNECMFRYMYCVARRAHSKVLRIAHRGKCLSADPCKPECQPTDDEPVCDSAAVTHANICTFQKINCERMGRGEQPRSIAHIGKCDSVAMQTDAYVSEDADRSELRDDEEGNHSAEIREVAQTSMVDKEQTKAAGDVLFVLTDSLTSSEQQSPNFSQSMPTTDAVLPVAQLSNSSEIRDMGNSETTSSASVTLPLRSMNAFGTSYYPLYRQTAKPESNQDTVNYVRTGLSANNSSITGVNKVRLPSEGILAKENRMYDATAFHKNTVLPPLLHGSGVVNSLDSDEIKTTSMQKTNAQLTKTASSIAVYQTVDDYRTQNNKSDRFGPLSQQPTINTHSAWSIDGALIKNRSEFVALLSTTEKSKIYRTDASDLNVASFYSFTKRIISSSEEERKHDVNETTALPWKALDENVRNLKLEQDSVETVSDSDLLIPKTVDGSDEDYSFSTDAASKLFTPSDGERLMRTTSAIAEAVEPLRNNNADKNNWDIPLKIVLSKSDDRAEEKTHRFEELAETPAKPSPIMTEVSVTSENTVNAENTTDEFLNIDRDSGDYAVPFVLEDDSSFEELKVNVSRLNDSVPNETEDQLSTVSSNFDKRNLAGEGEMAAQQTTNTMKVFDSSAVTTTSERETHSSAIEVGKRGDLKTQLEAPNAGNYSNWRDVADEVYPSEQSRFATICSAVDCDKTVEPVCDSNGRTHRNGCLFRFHQCKLLKFSGQRVQIVHPGQCDKQQWSRDGMLRTICGTCSTEVEMIPVCDNLNKTHQSICLFSRFNCEQRISQREQRVLVHLGSCHSNSPFFHLKHEVCPSKCSREYKPVCDSHGTTHPNLCAFQMYSCRARRQQTDDVAFLTSLHECTASLLVDKAEMQNRMLLLKLNASPSKAHLECPEPHCNHGRSPICDNEGKLHRNECIFAWARCLAAQEGRTLTIMPESDCQTFTCTQNCSNDYQPVCSSDFITYPNRCFFHKARCAGKNIEVLFNGECRECLPQPCPLANENLAESNFVCNQNEQTELKCEFEMLRCIFGKKYGYNVSPAYEGRCCPSKDLCADYTGEICDSNGRTHKNVCIFEAVKCRSLKADGIILSIVRNGSCESTGRNLQTHLTEVAEGAGFSKVNLNSSSEKTVEVCAQRTCPQWYQPVCGTDLKTYPNECVLQLVRCNSSSSLATAYEGECCFTSCPGRWQPVCDSRNVTHENLCEFGIHRCLAERLENANITISRYQACEHEHCARRCSQLYEPVCASNGETYRNECELNNVICVRNKKISPERKLIHFDYAGECCGEIKCDPIFSPVCDSEGKTHANRCEFRKAACLTKKLSGETLTVQYNRQCCNQLCDGEVKPVCDGENTYDNLCKFRVAQCEAERRGEILSLAYSGRCCEEPKDKCSVSGPLCDSEGQTHANMCRFLRKQCVLNKVQPKSLSIAHRGECCRTELCTTYNEPVCDTHGVTHASPCHFRNTKCIYDKMHFNATLQIDYTGACCVSSCDDTWDGVCDQNGVLYKNKCYFEMKRCEANRRHGSVLLQTPCRERQLLRVLRYFDEPHLPTHDDRTEGRLAKST